MSNAMGDGFVEDVVAALRGMSALRATQSFLRARVLASGRSWEEIAGRLRAHIEEDVLPAHELRELVIDLRSRLQKQISVYNVSKEVHGRLLDLARRTQDDPKSSTLGARFPLQLADSELETLGTKPRHVYTRTSTDGVEMFFTSARVGKRIDEIPIDEIAVDSRANYSDADRMFAERIERRQAFDIIFIPRKSRLIQIRVDGIATTGRDRTEEMRAELETMVIATTEITQLDFMSIGLFPAIRSIYDDAAEGRVIGLQFDCSTGANRREVMRKVTDDRDLRREPYHVAGVNEVDITPYWLCVELTDPNLKESERVEVVLPGTIRNLQGQPLRSFEISTFASETAIGHAVDVLFRHVSPT